MDCGAAEDAGGKKSIDFLVVFLVMNINHCFHNEVQ